MITHLNIGNGGRLGNAMFQYAAAKSLAIITNSELKLPHDIFNRIHDGQQCLLNHFNIDFKPINENDKIENLYMEKIGKKFDPEFLIQKPNTNLMGHFETERYFENIEEIIKHDFTHKDNLIEYANNYLISIKTKYTKDIQIIGIHFRRGDYLTTRGHHYLNDISNNSWLYNYLISALKQFESIENKVFLLFAGGGKDETNNTEYIWCKYIGNELFSRLNLKYEISMQNSSIEDHVILTNCDHIILTTLSTYSWWAGYLNPNKSAKIVVPSYVPNEADINDFWSKRFTII